MILDSTSKAVAQQVTMNEGITDVTELSAIDLVKAGAKTLFSSRSEPVHYLDVLIADLQIGTAHKTATIATLKVFFDFAGFFDHKIISLMTRSPHVQKTHCYNPPFYRGINKMLDSSSRLPWYSNSVRV